MCGTWTQPGSQRPPWVNRLRRRRRRGRPGRHARRGRVVAEGDQDSSGVARCLAPSPRKWRKVPDRPTRAQCDIQGDDRLVSGNLGFKLREELYFVVLMNLPPYPRALSRVLCGDLFVHLVDEKSS